MDPCFNVTTLRVENVPRSLTIDAVVSMLVGEGVHDEFDFLYLPPDRRWSRHLRNRGFFIVNFREAAGAQQFSRALDGRIVFLRQQRPAQVVAASLQGLTANVNHCVRVSGRRGRRARSLEFGPLVL